ncbi:MULTISPECIES: outer membrane lipoprotein chaperone LolA [Methylotuvimicrobium]|uniref:Outer-membrane lipoprotein carrier protein n=2 Tax=Methylotuvimicrobium TaxID=2822410 RepID=G4SV29_META2|nr:MULTISPECIES: outer membrane lipoprotein chaperone LolA [Methylotuvimicrobium]CCE25127.1 Outer-membrane lipoprotein carrier protein [Methylotuvimicrobium alcaliphilum 20Z]
MERIKYGIMSLLMAVAVMQGAHADDKPIEQLRDFLKTAHSLTADFRQVAIDESGRARKASEGVFYLRRPGKFRWNYLKPFTQEIISNAGKVWFYDEDLEQVTIKKMDQSLGSTPALLLSGDIDLEDNFILEGQGSDEDMTWIKLLPKNEDSGFKYILIGLDKGKLGGMELSDNFGQLTRIYFSNLKINTPIDDGVFDFIPPAGADVFEE